MSSSIVQRQNARYHIIEGMVYISTGAFISAQTMMPALIKRLGGSDVLVGVWPIVIYVAFFLPQVFSANSSGVLPFRKPIVLHRGLLQRLHLFLLACVLALWGTSAPGLTLLLLFLIFSSNQLTSGSISPIWMDFLAKTTSPDRRGKLAGWRTSFGALLGLVNGVILTALLTLLPFPLNYASAIGLACIYQMASWAVQRLIIEETPSIVSPPVQLQFLLKRLQAIVSGNRIFRKFLLASSFQTISFSSVAFFTVAAIQRFELSEAAVGIFTVITVAGQIVSGVLVGWIADSKGTKNALIICNASLLLSISFALWAPTVEWFYCVYAFLGINLGAEIFMRYNFAVECAPEADRPMYVGLMNAWCAPFYLLTPLAGWMSVSAGYPILFGFSFIMGITGFILLLRIPNVRATKLALSSK